MPTRTTILQRIAPYLGGYTGTITSGSATTAVLGGMLGNFPDDAWNDALLFMPDAANAGDMERVLTDWTGASGTATWSGNRTDTTYTSETYILLPTPGFTITEIRDAINEALRRTRFTARVYLPTLDNERFYSLAPFTWIRSRADVDAVMLRYSENLISNSNFELWGSGPAAAPTLWTLAGAGGTIARRTVSPPRGGFSARITRASATVTLTQALGLQNQQLPGLQVTARMVGVTGTASDLRLQINDGVTTTSSSYHTGGGTPEALSVTKTLASTATICDVIVSHEAGTTADVDHVTAVEGASVPQNLIESSAYNHEYPIDAEVVNYGQHPAVLLASSVGRGAQLVVISRMPYPSLSADTDTTDCPSEIVEHATLYHLARKHKPGLDRTRWDALEAEHGAAWVELSQGLIDRPTRNSRRPATVTGA